MNKDYLQALRYKLQRRSRSLKSTNQHLYRAALIRFWDYLTNEKLISLILIDLENRYKEIDKVAEVYCNIEAREFSVCTTEMEYISLCYFIVKRIVNDESLSKVDDIASRIGWKFAGGYDLKEGFQAFNDYVIESLYDFIDESIDDQRATLSYILRYKQRCEWFHNTYLYKMWEDNQSRGEKVLQKNLYEYLFDQGIEFSIEPTSSSGEIDLIENQIGENRLLVEIKIFNPGKGKDKAYIAKGFRQLYEYTLDYNEPFGYLVIFKTCEEDLRFSLEVQDKFFNFITYNNKIIFFILINIFDYEKPASQRQA